MTIRSAAPSRAQTTPPTTAAPAPSEPRRPHPISPRRPGARHHRPHRASAIQTIVAASIPNLAAATIPTRAALTIRPLVALTTLILLLAAATLLPSTAPALARPPELASPPPIAPARASQPSAPEPQPASPEAETEPADPAPRPPVPSSPHETIVARVGETVEIDVEVPGWDLGRDADCAHAWLDFDDGERQPLDCPTLAASAVEGAYPPPFERTVSHAYDAPGAYYPTLSFADHYGSERTVAAFEVHVAVQRVPPDPLATPLRPYLWKAVLLALAGIALIVWRHGIPRILGLAIVTAALAASTVMHARDASLRLHPSVEGLVGLTGLDPLRPDDPVAAARIAGASPLRGTPRMTLELAYDSGERATFFLPQYGPRGTWLQPFYHYDGFGRLRAQHAQLPGLPMADPTNDGIALSPPQPMTGHAPHDFGDRPWLDAACAEGGNLAPSPDERAIVLVIPRERGGTSLSLADLDDGSLRPLDDAAGRPRWSPDGAALVAVSPSPDDPRLVLWRPAGDRWPVERGPRVPAGSQPDISGGRVWALRDGGIWSYPLGDDFRDGQWRLEVPMAPAPTGPGSPAAEIGRDELPGIVRVSPDGSRVAYSCPRGICVRSLPADDSPAVVVAPAASAIEWSPDGSRLAVVSPPSTPRRLRIVGADGRRAHTVDLAHDEAQRTAPREVVGSVAWSRDGAWILAGTCPFDGRRIVAIDAARGRAIDLSQPRWDAWAAYLPESNALALWNGRGGLWRAHVLDAGATAFRP